MRETQQPHLASAGTLTLEQTGGLTSVLELRQLLQDWRNSMRQLRELADSAERMHHVDIGSIVEAICAVEARIGTVETESRAEVDRILDGGADPARVSSRMEEALAALYDARDALGEEIALIEEVDNAGAN